MKKIAEASLEYFSRKTAKNKQEKRRYEGTRRKSETNSTNDVITDIKKENTNKEATVNDDEEEEEPTSDISLGTFTSNKIHQENYGTDVRYIIQEIYNSKYNNYISGTSASTYTDNKIDNKDSESELSIG